MGVDDLLTHLIALTDGERTLWELRIGDGAWEERGVKVERAHLMAPAGLSVWLLAGVDAHPPRAALARCAARSPAPWTGQILLFGV